MAPPNRPYGGSYQNRRYQSAGYDRTLRSNSYRHQEFHRQPDLQSFHCGQAPMPYQAQHPVMNVPPNPQTTDPHRFLYPSGIPADYKMVDPGDNSVPRQFIDTLEKSFYSNPAKEVKAVFSTENGVLPVRYLSAQHVILERKMTLWSAEDIQTRANSIRKKFWFVMKNMPKPTCWEDLYDYFDVVEIYQHGPLNLWNLITHLHHENQELLKNLHNELAFVTGLWCDEWIAKEHNRQKLGHFHDWDQVLAIFDQEDLKEMQGMEPNKVEILKLALIHRQGQFCRQDLMQPSPYPINSLQFQWEHNNVQNWLADQPVPDTPSGLIPPESLTSVSNRRIGLGSIPEFPLKPARRAPLVVSGTIQPHKCWEKVQDADTIHGPVFRRSPTKEGAPQPRAFSQSSAKEVARPRTLSRASPSCPNQHHNTEDKFSYAPCACPACEIRERSVYISLRPVPQMDTDALCEKLGKIMSSWGAVEGVHPLQQYPDNQAFIVRFKDGVRITEAASINDWCPPDLQCKIWSRPMHYSKYGKAMRDLSALHKRRDGRMQVSLEHFLPPQAATPVPAPMPMAPSAEAEAQSKPPSEEVFPDEPSEKAKTPQCVETSGKTVKVNLPTTPPKTHSRALKEDEVSSMKSIVISPHPMPEKPEKYGVYRQAYTEGNAEQVNIYDLAPSRPILARNEAGRLLDVYLGADFGHNQGTPKTVTDDKDTDKTVDDYGNIKEIANDKKGKGKAKTKTKKKKKSLSLTQEAESSSSQLNVISTATEDLPVSVTEFVVAGLDAKALESETPDLKNFRANGGSSLRVSKIRRKQVLGITVADSVAVSRDAVNAGDFAPQTAASFVTAKDSSSDGSQGNLTPATPLSEHSTPGATTPKDHGMGVDATSKAIFLNPQAKEFVSPGGSGKRSSSVSHVKLAPIPLKPIQHKRSSSQSSSVTSHTLTAGSTPKKTSVVEDVNDSAKDILKDGIKDIADEKQSEVVPVNRGDKPASEIAGDNCTWEKPEPKRNFTKNNHNQGKHVSQHSQSKQEPNKNRHSPKKQKLQGQSHLKATGAPVSCLAPLSNWATTVRSGNLRPEGGVQQ